MLPHWRVCVLVVKYGEQCSRALISTYSCCLGRGLLAALFRPFFVADQPSAIANPADSGEIKMGPAPAHTDEADFSATEYEVVSALGLTRLQPSTMKEKRRETRRRVIRWCRAVDDFRVQGEFDISDFIYFT